MSIISKLSILIFFIRLFLPTVSCVDGEFSKQHEEIFAKLGMPSRSSPSTTTAATNITIMTLNRGERASNPMPNIQDPMLPIIQFCRENMSNIFCWVIFALLALSLIIYQLRSIFWLKKEMVNKNRHFIDKEYELIPMRNGQQTDNKDFNSESIHTLDIPRMLPM